MSEQNKKETRHLARPNQERILPFNPVNSRIEMKLPFFSFSLFFFRFLFFFSFCSFLFQDTYMKFVAFFFFIIFWFLFSFYFVCERNHGPCISLHLAQSVRQRPRCQVLSTSSCQIHIEIAIKSRLLAVQISGRPKRRRDLPISTGDIETAMDYSQFSRATGSISR